MKIDIVLLTGDTRHTAEAVAGQLGIRNVHANLLPEQKTAHIAEQVREGRVVAMLGDGINDAPTLSEATVGVAMGAGTDVARESADVVLIGNDLMKFVETVRVAKSCRSIILQNFYGTLIVDTIEIGLAAAGYLNPLLAAFIHFASELTFILNSTRLRPSRRHNLFQTEKRRPRDLIALLNQTRGVSRTIKIGSASRNSKPNADFSPVGSRSNEVSPRARGQEVVHRDFVRKIQDCETCSPFHAVCVEQVV